MVYLDIHQHDAARLALYRNLLNEGISEDDLVSIRQHLGQSKAWGTRRFQEQIEALTGRSAKLRRPGRPRSVD